MTTAREVMTMRVGEILDFGFNYRREMLFGDLLTATAGNNLWTITGTGTAPTLGAKTVNIIDVVIDSEVVPAYMLTASYLNAALATAGDYVVTNTVTTAQGRKFVKDFLLSVSV